MAIVSGCACPIVTELSFFIDQELDRAVGLILAVGDLGERLILLGEQFFDFAEAIDDDERENDPRDGKQDDEQADDEHQEATENACCCIGIGRRDHDFELNHSRMLGLQDRFCTPFGTTEPDDER
jgi:hypothetical protein